MPSDRAYNPLAYHRGTVWPHDTSIAAWGLARYGFWEESHALVRAVHRCPLVRLVAAQVFAGFSQRETPFPIAYPTAARPQAWAAGAPVLGLQLLLGLRPDPSSGGSSRTRHGLPRLGRRDRPPGRAGFGRTWDGSVQPGGAVSVAPS